MSGDDAGQGGKPLRYEHGIPILNTEARLSEVERKAAAAEARDQEYKNRQIGINSRMMIFTGLLVLTSLITGAVAIWQAAIANRSATAAKSAADIADATLKSSQKSFEIDQRPYLIVEEVPQFVAPGPVVNTGIKVSMYLKNIGRTPAAKEITNFHLLPYRASKDRSKYIAFIESAFSDIQKKNARGREELGKLENLSAEQDVAPTQHFFITSQEIVKLSTTEEQMVKSGEFTLFFVGVTDYFEAFNNSYETQFCYFYFGDDPKTWHICDSHNIIR